MARDSRLDREVALKLFAGERAHSEFARAELLHEARAAASLNHAHIAAVHDVLESDGQVAIVFEYVEGETLADRLRRGPLGVEDAITIGAQLADALAGAHQHGIVHRDLKPGNVVITPDGVVKVLDFGVARVQPESVDDASAARTTAAGFVGTIGYAAPEQCVGDSVDARADIFSLGVVLFEMLTHERPYGHGDAASVVRAMLAKPAPRVRSIRPDVPLELDDLVAAMLASDAAARPASARDVRTTLRAMGSFASQPVDAIDGASARSLDPRRASAAAAVALVALLTAALVMTLIGREPAAQADTPPVIAVLPLTNATGDPSKDYLAIGIADSLVTRLAGMPSVTLLSRGAVADARRRVSDIPTLAKELDVTYFIDGSVQQAADGLRIALNLIDARGAVHWADSFQGSNATIFPLQARVASAIAQALAVRLSAADRVSLARQPTASADALDAYWRGRALLARRDVRGNIDAALAAFDEAIALDERFADAHAARGEALWARYGETGSASFAQQAIAANTDALRYGPERAEVRYSVGLTLAGTGKLPEAVEELQRALLLRPNYDDARRELGLVLARQGHFDEAIAEFDKAIDLRPRYWGNYNALGRVLLQAGRYDQARGAFQKVIDLQPDSFIGHAQLGVLEQSLANYDAALAHYGHAIAVGADDRIYSNIGAIHHQRGEFRKAVAAYREALRLRPDVHVIHRNLGDALTRLGLHAEARASYERAAAITESALNVNPNDADALSSRAVYLAKLNRTQEAPAAAARARALAPDDPRVVFRQAVVLTLCNQPQAAIQSLREALARGYSHQLIAEDEDLRPLHRLPEFGELLQNPAPPR